MKISFVFLFFLCFSMACENQKLDRKETVVTYYNAFDSGNYKRIKALVSQNVTIQSGDIITAYDDESFYGFFRWDSIFKPSYDLTKLEEKNGHVFVTVAQANVRNAFLKNNPLVFQVKISFDSGKISKLEELEYLGVDWKIWNKEKESLVNWIKNNHPELDGFVNDMSMNGSLDYLKAIDLYTNRKGN